MPAPALHELDPTARARIGESTLRRLFKQINPDEKHDIDFRGIGSIQRDLQMAMRMQLPKSLVEMLELSFFSWAVPRPHLDTFPELYLGTSYFNPSLNNAEATVEIAHRSYPTRIKEGKVLENQREPILVRVTGVDGATNRIIAATYDALDGKLLKVNVSLSDDELPDDKSLNETEEIKPELTVSLPTNPEEPYATAGLVTPAMIAKTGGHRKALIVQERPNGWFFGKIPWGWAKGLIGEKYKHSLNQNNFAHQLGYHVEFFLDGMVTITYKPERDAVRPQWKIRIPLYLQSTASAA